MGHSPIDEDCRVGTRFSPLRVRVAQAIATAAVLAVPLAALAASQVAPAPRVLLRDPFGVPPAKIEEVEVTVAGAVREAGGAAIRSRDFARLVETRPDVKSILDGAREKVRSSGELEKQSKPAAAVKQIEGAVEDYDSIGIEVWNPSELAFAYARLCVARAHEDLSLKKPVRPTTLEACKRARALDPDITLPASEFKEADIAAFKKASAGAPATPSAPGDGFWSLARVMGLDGLIEIRSDAAGVLSLRAHRVHPVSVKMAKIASRAPGLDAEARKQLDAALGFITPNVAAAPTPSAAPSASATAVAAAPTAKASPTPYFLSDVEPAPTVTPRSTPVAARPTPTPKPVPSATPAPTAVASNDANGSSNGNGGFSDSSPRPHATPGHISLHSQQMPGGDSWVALLGGTDHRGAVYSATDHFVNVASGDGASVNLRAWISLSKDWAVDAGGAGLTRAYLVAANVKKSGMAEEAWAHILHGDDASGVWWIGGGVGYLSEPKFILPGPGAEEIVPGVTRVIPAVVGVARINALPRLELRGRGVAGVAIETTGAGFGNGVGFDIAGDATAAYAVTNRVRLAAGGGMHRITSQYSNKQTEIEVRRSVWAGVEAAF